MVVVSGPGAMIAGGTLVASAEGGVTEFVLRLIVGEFAVEGAVAAGLNGAGGIAAGALRRFVNAAPADL